MTTNDQPQTIPANLTRDEAQAVREWAERARAAEVQDETVAHAARVLLAVLPPRPTMAEMTPEERRACKRMQAEVANRSVRYVIVNPYDEEGDAALTSADGGIEWFSPDRVTPRPDLPRLEWPGTEKPAPALPEGWRLADHPDHGRVIVTRPEPDGDGEVAITVPTPTSMIRARRDWCRPDELTYIDTGQEVDQ